MALTADLIKANSALATLTPEQISALVVLSTNDEQAVMNERIGKLHGQYDEDIKSVLGLEKPQGKKTYDFLKETLTDLKAKAEGGTVLTSQIEALKAEKSALEKKIKDGTGDESLKAKVTESEKLVEQLRGQIKEKEKEWEKKYQEADTRISRLKVDTEFDREIQKLKFKDEKVLPVEVRNTFIQAKKETLLTKYKTSMVDEAGGKRLVFLDEKNEILRNPENGLHPYTAGELLSKDLKDILATPVKQTGTGRVPDEPGAPVLDISSARTKTEADKLIEEHLLRQGMLKQDSAFADKHAEIRDKLGVDKLPIR
jgi:hypothetical protein